MTVREKFKGVGVALITPFKKDGSVDFPALKCLVENCSTGKVDYLVVNGTTSEASTIEPDEKLAILEFIIQNNTKKLPIMYGIGANSTQYVLDLIKHTTFAHVDAILTVTPYYNKPGQEGIYQHYMNVADNSPVPVLLYNVPGRTGVNMDAATTTRLAKHDNIFGIKEASGDLEQCLRIIRDTDDDFMLISGDDILTIPMIAFGAKGVISVIANAYPEKFGQAIHDALDGNFKEATKSVADFLAVNDYLYAESNPVGIKEVLQYQGVCENHCRLPLISASEGLSASIKETMV